MLIKYRGSQSKLLPSKFRNHELLLQNQSLFSKKRAAFRGKLGGGYPIMKYSNKITIDMIFSSFQRIIDPYTTGFIRVTI